MHPEALPDIVGMGSALTVMVLTVGGVAEHPLAAVYETLTCCDPGKFQKTVIVLVPEPAVIIPPEERSHEYPDIPASVE